MSLYLRPPMGIHKYCNDCAKEIDATTATMMPFANARYVMARYTKAAGVEMLCLVTEADEQDDIINLAVANTDPKFYLVERRNLTSELTGVPQSTLDEKL